jgi:hypothetical protein
MWTNLKKTDGMEVGQVGIHKEKEASFRLFANGRAGVSNCLKFLKLYIF